MDMLLVAPTVAGVSSAREIARVVQGHRVVVVDGAVDRQKLELALATEQVEAAHFLQHGDRRVLELADGAMEAGELVAMLRQQRRLRFVVLNACDSISTAVEIHNALDLPVVAHNAPIDDQAAVRFAEALYRGLGSGLELGAAVEAARGVLTRLFPYSAAVPQLINGNMGTLSAVKRLDACWQEVRSDIEGLRAEMNQGFKEFNGRLERVETSVSRPGGLSARWATVLLALLLLAQVATVVAQVAK